MKRYIDFQNERWPDRTLSRMLDARLEACLNALEGAPPDVGVIDNWPAEDLTKLLAEGWLDVPHMLSDALLRRAARRQMMATLSDDLDCLSPTEYALVEKMLIGDGVAALETGCELEAAFTLRMRLWCDAGVSRGSPCARLDARLMTPLPKLMMRRAHQDLRARLCAFGCKLRGLLYLTGFLDERLARLRFIEEVLRCPETPEASRLAQNYLESSFDCQTVSGCRLLLHESLADPEALIGALTAQGGMLLPEMTEAQFTGAMLGLLPEEEATEQKLRLTIENALRPDMDAREAVRDLRLLSKQGASQEALREALGRMLLVLPTAYMESALLEMSCESPRWINPWTSPPQASGIGAVGMLH